MSGLDAVPAMLACYDDLRAFGLSEASARRVAARAHARRLGCEPARAEGLLAARLVVRTVRGDAHGAAVLGAGAL